MTTAAPTTCPRCHAAIPATAPEGLCPRCLLFPAAVPAGARTEVDRPAAALPGERLRYLGDYELMDEIARGGMGVVWRARQVSLDRVVAVKMLLAGSLADAAAVQRFLREAEAAASLAHPNIVAIHEVGRAGDQHYYSMDYVPGPSLAGLVASGPIPAPRAVRLASTIARAVDFAHRRGILHRDLKPHNVLMDGDSPRIADFGLARSIDGAGRLTESGAVLGSPSYMPPEQALGRLDRVGPASDVYGVGAILYEMLTGRPPFAGATSAEVVHRLVDEPPVPPRRIDARIPADLETICLKCLEKLPERRYPTAGALADDLDRFAAGAPIVARRPSAPARAGRWMARNPWTLCALAAVLLVCATGALYGLWAENERLRWSQAHPETGAVSAEEGARADALEGLAGLCTFAFGVLAWLSLDFMLRARQGGWRRFRETMKVDLHLPPRALAGGLVFAYGVAGAAGVVLALALALRMIDVYVWEGTFSWRLALGSVYPCLWFGLALVVQVVRHHVQGLAGLHTEPPAKAPAPVRRFSTPRLAAVSLVHAAVVVAVSVACPWLVELLPSYVAAWGFGLAIVVAQQLEGRRARLALLVSACVLPPLLYEYQSSGGTLSDSGLVAIFAGVFAGVYCATWGSSKVAPPVEAPAAP